MSVLRWPDFMIVGGQKTGSTWAYKNLSRHPKIWMGPIKEYNYYNELATPSQSSWQRKLRELRIQEARHRYSRDVLAHRSYSDAIEFLTKNGDSIDWYERVFSFAPISAICGEASVEYCCLSCAEINKIYKDNPALRLILIVRDPIDRAWSQICMLAGQSACGRPSLPFVKSYSKEYFVRSDFPTMIRNWLQVFREEALLIIDYDNIALNPHSVLKSICDHIGIAYKKFYFSSASEIVFPGPGYGIPDNIYALLRSEFQEVYEELVMMAPWASKWKQRHHI